MFFSFCAWFGCCVFFLSMCFVVMVYGCMMGTGCIYMNYGEGFWINWRWSPSLPSTFIMYGALHTLSVLTFSMCFFARFSPLYFISSFFAFSTFQNHITFALPAKYTESWRSTLIDCNKYAEIYVYGGGLIYFQCFGLIFKLSTDPVTV